MSRSAFGVESRNSSRGVRQRLSHPVQDAPQFGLSPALSPPDRHVRQQRPGHHLKPVMESRALSRKDPTVRPRDRQIRGVLGQGIDALRHPLDLAALQRRADRPRGGKSRQIREPRAAARSLQDADQVAHCPSVPFPQTRRCPLSTALIDAMPTARRPGRTSTHTQVSLVPTFPAGDPSGGGEAGLLLVDVEVRLRPLRVVALEGFE
jgi:hypothetical protein